MKLKTGILYIFPLLFILCLITLSSCKETETENDTEERTEETRVQFNNLEQYPVTVYSDAARQIALTWIDALSLAIIPAIPAPYGTAFYPTFNLDLFGLPGINIPYNAPHIVTMIEDKKTTIVPIPKLESIEIDSAYIKITNNSDFSLTLRQGNTEILTLGSRDVIVMTGQIAVYEVTPGSVSSYSFMRNTTIPVEFPLSEFKRGIIYSFTYTNGGLELTARTSVLQSIPPATPLNVQAQAISNSNVSVTWDEVYGATVYRIYRAAGTPSAAHNQIGSTAGLSYTDTTISAGQTYYYSVSAESGTNKISVRSPPVSVNLSPSNFRSSSSTTLSITLAWNAFNGASGYNVYRSDTENGTYTQINTALVTGTVLTDTDVLPDTTYYYKISAVIGDNETLQSEPVSASTLSPVPVNLRTTASTTVNINLAWNIVNGADGYNVYRSININGDFIKLNTGLITETTFLDNDLLPDTAYYYKVSSINNGTESLQSGTLAASTLSSIPLNVHSTANTTVSINLAWDIISGAGGYNVYRSDTENGVFTKINSVMLTGTTFLDTEVIPDKNYYYKVSSINNGIEGLHSNSLSVATLSSIPGNIRVSSVTTTRVNLAWNAVSGASGYNVYRSTDENGVYTKVNAAVITGTTYVDTGLSFNTVYYYKIISINNNIEGILSDPITSTTLSAIPANVRVTASTTNSVSLAWNTVSEASGYNVYRSVGENGTYTKINTSSITATSFTDTGLSSYSTYYYKISAIINNIERDMSVFVSANTGIIVPRNSFAEMLSWLQGNAVSNSVYLIEVTADENIGNIPLSYFEKSNITIIIRGINVIRTISITHSGSNLSIGSGVTLILDNNITIRRGSYSERSLVYVNNNSSFIMNTGSKICDNGYLFTDSSLASTQTYGGGVYIAGGTFTMNGGEITNNYALYGLGVYVSSGTFTMNGGKITGNKFDDGYGGGVYVNSGASFTMTGGEISGNGTKENQSYNVRRGGGVYSSGTFRMSGGVIYGSNASASLQNKAATGAALYRSGGTAQYGTFNGTAFTSSGNLNTTDTTIRITNGNLQTN